MFATFELAIRKAAGACPAAEALMGLCAFLAPERIPLDIVTADVMSEIDRGEAVAVLQEVSLASLEALDDGSAGISVHRFVQEVMMRRARRSTRRPSGRPPQRRHGPQQPGAAAAGHQPAGRGRAADAARLAIDERLTGPTTPTSPSASTTWRELLKDTNRLGEAEPLIGARWRSTRGRRARPPQRRHPPQQPGAAAAGHEPAGRGRAVMRARWRSTRSYGPTTPTSPSPQQSGATAAGHESAGRGRAADAARAGY